ncbi:hypothetical protein CRENBAI_008675 [Crenichthys baileyi]|uniref:Uncharacterized protein n=1 Tax=Crenichthys baileyi TaxID=28760 RepID=A0AAV9RSK2_9TELE
MRATFQYRQTLVQDQQCSSTVLDVFPRFLNIAALMDQDFTMMFGEEVILTECRKLTSNEHIEELLSAQHHTGWDSDLSTILLLLHLLPPTSKGHKKSQRWEPVLKPSSLVRNQDSPSSCVGENKSSIQRYYIIIDLKAIPCKAQTSLAAFNELFKAHFIFSINQHESLYNFYTFIQTTVFNIDVCQGKSQSQEAKSKTFARRWRDAALTDAADNVETQNEVLQHLVLLRAESKQWWLPWRNLFMTFRGK